MTDFSVWKTTREERAYQLIALLGAAVILALLLYDNILFGIIMIPFYRPIERMMIQKRIEIRKREYLKEFKDFLFIAATSIGAGRSMKDAIGESIPGIRDIYGEKAVLVRELRIVYERIHTGNEDDIDVLMDLALLSGMEDVVDFVTIYSTCKATGASLILAMNRAATMIIDKMTIDREIQELVRRKELEGLAILMVPIIVILFLRMTAPDYIAPLYETLMGRIIMTGVIAGIVGIYEIVQRIVTVDI